MPGTYRERPSRLDGAVLWRREADPAPASGPAPGPAAYPVLPDGCMDLILIDGRLIVAGPDTRAHAASDSPGGRYTGIRFAPGTGAAFLGVPAHTLRDRRVPLDAVWAPGDARQAGDRIAGAADPAGALEEFALRRAAGAGPPDPVMRAVAAALEAGATVGAAAEAVGLGTRQLHRRSLDAFGYGPKTLARVLRLRRALGLVREGTPFAEAAHRSGCADQAHLARETRELAGMTLRAYAALAARQARSSAKSETPSPSGSSTTA
ncbi:helix-turn-helix domain-containing protein [Streptomyces sp. NPDC088745]|uniref:helix-turn-helix domain-containing protein n=1 Tax=Streptomyces sp. NPDC088745 TaxID=3365884 RepID=UPI003829458F